MSPLVSIIVPVFNGITYLERLITCILKQTYKNLQVIIIDDYSTDNSFEYLQNKLRNDTRFVILRPPVKGGTASINIEYGLKIAKGEYYFYMSQDDFMDFDCIEKCLYKALSQNADIVIPNCISYYDKNKQINRYNYPVNHDYNSIITNELAFSLTLDWQLHGFNLRKIDLFKKTGFDGKYYNSDEYYVRLHYLLANCITFCDTNFYYNQSNENAMTKKFYYRQVDSICVSYKLGELIDKYKLGKKNVCIISRIQRSLLVYFLLNKDIRDLSINERKYIEEVIKEYLPMIKKYVWHHHYLYEYLRLQVISFEVLIRKILLKSFKKDDIK